MIKPGKSPGACLTLPEKLDVIVAMGADREIHRGALAVGSNIVRYIRADWGYACPSRTRLADESGLTKPAVTQALNKLVETGWIEVLQRAAGTKSAQYVAGPKALRAVDKRRARGTDGATAADIEALLS